jgi:SAM-dependent methyltransferase
MLEKSSSDQYCLFRKLRIARMSEITRAIAYLQSKDMIRATKHRKNRRTGLAIPIYSLSKSKSKPVNKLDIDALLAGVISERLVEYSFVARNLISAKKEARILEVGAAESGLSEAIGNFGNKKWQVFAIDISDLLIKSDFLAPANMDGRSLGFRDGVFDQIICVSTIEHVGISSDYYNIRENDLLGDMLMMSELWRVLKEQGTLILTLPYGNGIKKNEFRIYDNPKLRQLIKAFSVIKKEFYRYDSGRWKKCQGNLHPDEVISLTNIPSCFHSPTCACLLLKK